MTLLLGITKYTIESVRAASKKLPKTVLFGSEGNNFCGFFAFSLIIFLSETFIFLSAQRLQR